MTSEASKTAKSPFGSLLVGAIIPGAWFLFFFTGPEPLFANICLAMTIFGSVPILLFLRSAGLAATHPHSKAVNILFVINAMIIVVAGALIAFGVFASLMAPP